MPNAIRAALAILLASGAAFGGGKVAFETRVKRGQTALDTGRFQEAVEIFERASKVEPDRKDEFAIDWAWAHVQMGCLAQVDGDLARAADLYGQAVNICPSLTGTIVKRWTWCRLHLLADATRAAVERGMGPHWEPLAKEARAIVKLVPGSKWAHYLLGHIYDWQDKDALARKEFLTALKPKRPGGKRSLDALRKAAWGEVVAMTYRSDYPIHPLFTKSEPGKFQVHHWGSFMIFHHNKKIAERIGRALMYHLRQPVLDGLLPANDKRIPQYKVYVLRNKDEYEHPSERTWGAAHARPYMASMVCQQEDPRLTDRILPHELAHLRAPPTSHLGRSITFVDEGIAVAAEPSYSKRHHAKSLARAREKGKLIPVARLIEMTYPRGHSTADVFYGESLALIESLVNRFGKYKLQSFISKAKQGTRAEAMQKVYGLDTDALETMLNEWIDAQLHVADEDDG